MGNLLLGIDCGLTVTKAAVFTEDGSELGMASAAIGHESPHPRWIERDMNAVWINCARVVREALAAAGAAGSDIAEWIPSNEDLSKETIISADPNNREKVVASTKEYDNSVIGIVATQPGWLMGDETKDGVQMALSGRVPVRVTLKNGEIKIGDPITTSSIKGVGMKATKAGPIVGKAMEAVNETSSLTSCTDPATGKKEKCATALVFINISWYAPTADQTEDYTYQVASGYYEPLSLGSDFATGDVVSLIYQNAPKQGNSNEFEKVGYLNKSMEATASQTVGVISTVIGGQGDLLRRTRVNNQITSELRLVSTGKTEVKIAPDSESILPGDPIVVSGSAGLGTKASRAGQIIGRAMQAWNPGSGKSTISVMINSSWFDPYAYVDNLAQYTIEKSGLNLLGIPKYQVTDTASGQVIDRAGIFSDLLAGSISSGKLDVTGTINASQIMINGSDISDTFVNLFSLINSQSNNFLSVQNDISSTTEQISILNQQISPLYSGININSSLATSAPFMNVDALGNVGIGTTNPTEKLTVAGNINLVGGSFISDGVNLNSMISGLADNQNKIVNQLTNQLADQNLSVSEKLNIIGTNLDNLNSEQYTKQIKTIKGQIEDNLTQTNTEIAAVQALQIKLQQQMDDMAALEKTTSDFITSLDVTNILYKDEFGNLNLGEGKITAVEVTAGVFAIKVVDKDTATIGEGLIKAGDTSVIIETAATTENSKVFVTLRRARGVVPLKVSKIDEGKGFTVEIGEPSDEDISFDWWIIEKK